MATNLCSDLRLTIDSTILRYLSGFSVRLMKEIYLYLQSWVLLLLSCSDLEVHLHRSHLEIPKQGVSAPLTHLLLPKTVSGTD